MKVVHVATIDCGGAFIATKRISESLFKLGVDSKILVRSKTKQDSEVIEVFSNQIQKTISKVKNVGNFMLSTADIKSSYFGTDISEIDIVQNADIVVLHWIQSFISYKGIELLLSTNKPIVIVLHDTYFFTGGCHIPKSCKNYERECGLCPVLPYKRNFDITKKNFLRKKNIFSKGKVTFVGPSNWIVECAGKSSIVSNMNHIYRIPNPININIFKELQNKIEIRRKYGINIGKKVILYGAINIKKDSNKGINYLNQIINMLSEEKYCLVIFGKANVQFEARARMEIIYLDYIESELELAEVYNLADIYLSLSIQESFGQTISEAIACNVFVVAFGVGGILDQIEHKKNGYLAKCFDIKDILRGISWCVSRENIEQKNNLLLNNTMENVGKTYYELLQKLLKEQKI